jgi:urease accessory protein
MWMTSMSIDSYLPQNVPPELQAYFTKSQSKVGKPGKIGILRLKFERDSTSGITVIRDQYSHVPLLAQRAIYLEETLPAMAYVYIVSPSGGILQGDRYKIDITMGHNTLAHVTTQGATRIYKMQNNYASQIVNIKVEKNGYFEYIPDQIIPFRNSRFYQEVHLNVHDTATMIYSEIIVPGRVASGEAFEYDICYIKTIGMNHLGNPRFKDTINLEPKKNNLRTEGILGNLHVVGTIYIITKESSVNDLHYKISNIIIESKSREKISAGTSILPGRQGIMVRILGKSTEDVKKMIYSIISTARKNIMNASFSGIRKA